MAHEPMPGHPAEDPFATSAGPYVLGALAPAERAAFEGHLRGCPACRTAVEQLAGLPGLLSRTPPEVVEALAEDDPAAAVREGAGLPATVLPALLRAVRRRRRSRRVALAGGLVAAGALVAATAGALEPWTVPGAPTAAPTAATSPTASASPAPGGGQTMQPLVPVPISATVQLTEVGWGTKVDLVCAYAQATAEQSHRYALVVEGVDGGTEQIGTWTAVPGRDAQLSGATALHPEQIASVQVQTLEGTTVLRLQET